MTQCPYCQCPEETHGPGLVAYICGTRVSFNGRMRRQSAGCRYILELHADIARLLAETKDRIEAGVREFIADVRGAE